MKTVTYEETLFDYQDAILNEEFEGFKEDYLILHSLIRKYKPKTFFECGTNMGTGTNIICNAVYKNRVKEGGSLVFAPVCSLDLPTDLAHISLQHPISEGKGDKVGINCKFPYTQLRGDSMTFDFSKYPCEGYFIDGEHDYKHVNKETFEACKFGNLIIWHDADLPEVWQAIEFTVPEDFELFRVKGTRIAYALRK